MSYKPPYPTALSGSLEITEDQLEKKTFYGVCQSTGPASVVTFYRSAWLSTDDPTRKKPTLNGKVYYFVVNESSCTAVKWSDVLNEGASKQNAVRLDWVGRSISL